MSRQPRTDLTPPKISDQPGRQGNDNHGNIVKPPSSVQEMVLRKKDQMRAKYNNMSEEQQALLYNRALSNFPQLMMIIDVIFQMINESADKNDLEFLEDKIKRIRVDIRGIKGDLDGMARHNKGIMSMESLQASMRNLQQQIGSLRIDLQADSRGIKGDLDGMARGRRALEARIRSLEDRMQLLDNNAAEEAR